MLADRVVAARPGGLAPRSGGARLAAGGAAARRPRHRRHAAGLRTAAAAPSSAPVGEQEAAGGACPFLAALPAPPPAGTRWHERVRQLFAPLDYQRGALGPHSVVADQAGLGLPDQLVVGDPELVRKVFNGEADGSVTVSAASLLGSRKLVGGSNLLMSPEPRHKYLRALIMPAFAPEAIEAQVPRMERVLRTYLDKWAGAPRVLAHEELRRMTFEFIVAIVMGADYDASTIDRLSNLFSAWTGGLLAWPFLDLPFTPFGRAMAARRELLAFFAGAVERARADLAAGRAVPGVLGALVGAVDDEGRTLSDVELGDNLLLVLLAGHDTSSTTLTNVLVNLQDHPEAMAQLRAEQAALVARRGAAIDGAALREMHYAEAVIRETLRLNNVVVGLMRSAAKDFELGGYRVPAGSTLYLALSDVALRDARWADDDPAAFRPARMLTPEGQRPGALMRERAPPCGAAPRRGRPPAARAAPTPPPCRLAAAAAAAFGHGPRFCAGYALAMAEMKTFLALLARDYDFDADTNTAWRQEIGRVPKNGLPTTVRRRSAAAAAAAPAPAAGAETPARAR
ncbi:CYP716B1 [Scenedesmus sp. PABB004]|nr:CYP716B1 [Scenedesmus sp. PABB004]